MNRETIIRALEGMKVETGSLICLGCAYEDHCSTRGCAVMREAARTLKQMTEGIAPENNAVDWISVEDRLPKALEQVIVCRPYDKKTVRVEQGHFEGVNGWWKVYGTRCKRITHWLPMPNPPEDAYE